MQRLLDLHPDEVVSLRYVGPRWIRTQDGIAESGDTFEATWGWVIRRRIATWFRGHLEAVEDPRPATCKGTKVNGQPCTAKPMSGSQYCWHHEGQ